jgi:teichoic acid transport system ATP-binding protein
VSDEVLTTDVSVVMDRVTVDYSVATSEPRSSRLPKVVQAVAGLFTPPARTSVHAVRDVSMVARVGESIGIIGSNGSGKSSLMRALAGLHPPTSGSIYAAHTPVLLGVNAALLPDLPGARNIMLGCMAMGLTQEEARDRFDEICELAGIGDSIYLPMRTYSSGMAARLNFAIATAVRPKILLIDEALNTGDAEFKARSSQRMDEVREHAGTVFLVSHSLSTVKSMCSRVLWLERGVLRMDGSPEEVVGRYQEHQKAIADARKSGKRRPAPPWESGQLPPVSDPFSG